jgi:microcystin-dependent protein
MLLTVLLIKSVIFTSVFGLPDNNNNKTSLIELKSSDFVFDTPDVVKEYVREDGSRVRLDAYRTKNNDALLTSGQFSGLRWVSLGKPELVKLTDQDLFDFQNKLTFSLHFGMLTNIDKEVLADEVKRAKGFTVNPTQFSDINANTIECSIELYNLNENKIYILKGKVFDMSQSPYKVDFKYPLGTKERLLFQEEIKDESINIEFKCTATAGAQIQKSNTFTLTLQEINNIRLVEKLFGPANESFVTRDQLTELSNEVDSYFNVVENYQIPQEQFSSNFVDNLITLTGQTTFKPVSFEDALASLSKYSLDISGDLNANKITKELSEIFKIEKLGNKSHIIFDEKYYQELEKLSSSSGSGSASVGVFGLGGGKASAQYAQSQSDYWLDKGSSLNDQLSDLNTFSENKIKYEFEGNKIVPKSLQVSKLQASSFKRTLSFSRIKNYYYEADFNKMFTLNIKKKKDSINQFQLDTKKDLTILKDRIYKLESAEKYLKHSILMLSSQEMLKLFDANGKGFNEMAGWYLCDGRNGTPNLKGKFLVGRDQFTPGSYANVGMTGGQDYVQLSGEELPVHSHQFSAQTSATGWHQHRYMDVTYADGCDFIVPRYRGIRSGDANNRACQIERFTDPTDNHGHSVSGTTSGSGASKAHENRPPYYVIAYIIFLGK